MEGNAESKVEPEDASRTLVVAMKVESEDEVQAEEVVVVVVEEVTNADGEEVVVVVEEEEAVLPIVIEVNRKPVTMDVRRATGSQIKAAAIAQGVQIEMDFLLAVRRHGRTDPVRDGQEVVLHQGECFVANAADDNS